MLPSPNPAVIFQMVSEGAVLLHAEDEIYFGLNSVGAKVWQLLPPTCAELDDLCSRIGAIYADVEPDLLRADIVELLGDLRDNHLVIDSA